MSRKSLAVVKLHLRQSLARRQKQLVFGKPTVIVYNRIRILLASCIGCLAFREFVLDQSLDFDVR